MLFAYIEGMDDRQTIILSIQLEASGMVFILVNSKTPTDNPVSRKNLADVIIVNANKVTTVLVIFETGTIFMEIDSSRTPVPSIMKVHDNHGNYFPCPPPQSGDPSGQRGKLSTTFHLVPETLKLLHGHL